MITSHNCLGQRYVAPTILCTLPEVLYSSIPEVEVRKSRQTLRATEENVRWDGALNVLLSTDKEKRCSGTITMATTTMTTSSITTTVDLTNDLSDALPDTVHGDILAFCRPEVELTVHELTEHLRHGALQARRRHGEAQAGCVTGVKNEGAHCLDMVGSKLRTRSSSPAFVYQICKQIQPHFFCLWHSARAPHLVGADTRFDDGRNVFRHPCDEAKCLVEYHVELLGYLARWRRVKSII